MQKLATLFTLATALTLAGCGGPSEPEEAAEPPRTILVTGATGTQGGAVARELLKRGYPVRALTRNPEQPAATALAAQGAEVVQGNFDDPASLAAAMAGAWGVFAVTDFWEHGREREEQHGRALIDAAEQAGVGHFVYTSVAAADSGSGLAHFESKYEIEQMLDDSDLDFTVVRPVEFMDNWRWSLDALRAGRYVNPRDPGDRHQWIAASDIGFFVGEAFDNPDDWIGRTEEIAGDEMTLEELTGVMSEAFDRPVEYVQVSWEEFEEMLGTEMTDMYRWFADVGYSVNIEALRSEYPDLVTVHEYLDGLAASGASD